jgi:hypothetical protein
MIIDFLLGLIMRINKDTADGIYRFYYLPIIVCLYGVYYKNTFLQQYRFILNTMHA